ncbi:hypothetical protein HDF16_006303 [Granulicella aggregans]|uniref:Uncharacterized protein n=1 Tax=Granulicella aggregans TaxID=474949 RepID=A0A7W7ZKI1_9BACT|nr:hypothetical protein [Granulicella aggregans]MBB5061567.1 hypothetical protein [Granulicella aggregans]
MLTNGPTIAIFREIIQACQIDKETLEHHKIEEGADAPNQAEQAAIERVQLVLREAIELIRAELPSEVPLQDIAGWSGDVFA